MIPRVAYQGVPGAFSEAAIRVHWPEGAIAVPAETFAEALSHVADGRADFAAIPVENVIAGPVQAALAALNDAKWHRVLGSVRLEISLCLMGRSESPLEQLREVHSHHMALAQSRRFFQEHPWLSPVEHADTAGAARDVSQQSDHTVAAIASAAAATQYGLNILARDVQDTPDNWTRFVIVGHS